MLNIQAVMREKGVTRQMLADKLELNPVSVSRMINGNPTVESLNRIAAALDVEVVDLFEDNREKPASITCPNCGTDISIKVESR